MNIKMPMALLVIACTGCGAQAHNVAGTTAAAQASRAVPASHAAPAWPVDAVLIEQACFAFSECRTTSNGLGV